VTPSNDDRITALKRTYLILWASLALAGGALGLLTNDPVAALVSTGLFAYGYSFAVILAAHMSTAVPSEHAVRRLRKIVLAVLPGAAVLALAGFVWLVADESAVVGAILLAVAWAASVLTSLAALVVVLRERSGLGQNQMG